MAVSILQFPLMARSADAPPAAAAGRAAPAPAKPFPILEYRVEGNTVMRAIDIERAVTPYLGLSKSIKDVEAARKSLENAYHSRGYQTVLVNVPPRKSAPASCGCWSSRRRWDNCRSKGRSTTRYR